MTSGYAPLGALHRERPGRRALPARTATRSCTASPSRATRSSCAVALESIEIFENERILEHVTGHQDYFHDELETLRELPDRRRRARHRLLLGHRARAGPGDARRPSRPTRRRAAAARLRLARAVPARAHLPLRRPRRPRRPGRAAAHLRRRAELDFMVGTLREVLAEAVVAALSGGRPPRVGVVGDAAEPPPAPRPPLDGDLDVDVAIVGAGFTGLWTALVLVRATTRPARRRPRGRRRGRRRVGSQRRLGVGAVPASRSPASRRRTGATRRSRCARTLRDGGRRARATSRATRGSSSTTSGAARSRSRAPTLQAERLRARARRAARRSGDTDDDLAWLDERDARGARCGARDGRSARLYTPHCAAVHPAKLAVGLADGGRAPGRRDLRAHARSPRSSRRRGGVAPRAVTDGAASCAPTSSCARPRGSRRGSDGARRDVVPLYSLVVATEPLDATFFDRVGLAGPRDLLRRPPPHHLRAAHRRRPARLRRARRAVPLRLARRPRASTTSRGLREARSDARRAVRRAARQAITHRWGGPLGVARDFVAVRAARPRDAASRRPAATSATASCSATSRAARSPTSSSRRDDGAHDAARSSGTARGAGSPSRCGGSGSTAACYAAGLADRREARDGTRRRGLARVVERLQRRREPRATAAGRRPRSIVGPWHLELTTEVPVAP